MENLHDKQSKASEQEALMESTAGRNAEALEGIGAAIRDLFMQDDAGNLQSQLWGMFKDSITGEDQDAGTICDRVVFYEIISSLLAGLGQLERRQCHAFKITCEPPAFSQ